MVCMDKAFVGRHSISMDSKGRVIVPQEYREVFGERVVVSNAPDVCLYLYTESAWQDVSEKIMAIPDMNKPKVRAAKRFLFGNTFYCDIDKQGRILIPKQQREYAGLESSVTFIGAGKRIELWNQPKDIEPEKDVNMSEVFEDLEGFEI